jgi:tetratricopeptide (TPR) repeat protein
MFAFMPVLFLLAAVCPLCAQDAATWANFQQKAAAWRALPVKPAISEEVRLERVQAENAFKEKRLADAVAHYESGLKFNPLWPEGHFNAALIYAELDEYDKAVWHMRAYVELVPDAPDARTARDQIAVWRDKSKLLETVVYLDPATKLMWTRHGVHNDMNTQDWANNYCKHLSLGGYSGWRLPAMEELKTIYDKRQWHHINSGIQLSKDGGSVETSSPYFLRFFGSHGESVLCVRRPGE